MYKVFASEESLEIEEKMNAYENDGYKFVFAVGLAKIGYLGTRIIMHKD